MNLPPVLWVDYRKCGPSEMRREALAEVCELTSTKELESLSELIHRLRPAVLFFEYDYPDTVGLRSLQQIKVNHPSIPIVMITESHSEALAVWALRTRVWNYLVNPVSDEALREHVAMLSNFDKTPLSNNTRPVIMPHQPIPTEFRFTNTNREKDIYRSALTYINGHYHEKIQLSQVANHCGLSPSQFSRSFKREQGQTFRDFLIQFRIRKARDLLKHPCASVIDVAFAVGFNDHSYFTRMFRRHVGVPPSSYRTQHVHQ